MAVVVAVAVAVIVATQGAPSTWVAEPVPSLSTGATLDAVACSPQGMCLAVDSAGQAVASTDGGTSWRLGEPLTGPFADVLVSGCIPRLCLAVTDVGVVDETSDGGETVTGEAVAPFPASEANPLGEGSMSCAPSGTFCLVLAGRPGHNVMVGTFTRPLRENGGSFNRGATLRTHGDRQPDPPSVAVSCPTVRLCLGLSDTGDVWRTADGGRTWVDEPPAKGPWTSLACGSVAFCLAVGDADTYEVTTDGGKTWAAPTSIPGLTTSHCASPLCGSQDELGPAACWSPSSCVVAGIGPPTTAFAMTSNRGASWRLLSVPDQDVSVSGLSCWAKARCVAVGWRNGSEAPAILQLDGVRG